MRRTGRPSISFASKQALGWNDSVESAEVAQSTVAKYMARSGRGRSQTWESFCIIMRQASARWTSRLSALENRLILRHCCYWSILQSHKSGNAVSERIFVPLANLPIIEALEILLVDERNRRLGV